MPFKLKLKKSKHYSVVSKNLFVISVEILDGTNVECTLSSESTGQDCLDVVCQKLCLNQPHFFGLQYISCHSDSNLCWVELDKPIKRQLDKHARALCAYLRVMYYVISGVKLITDEVTRYHFFLQLKQDVIEGRISCSPQQAIELASYSMQAEFGNFDAERHTAHYLKDFQLFPKAFTDPIHLESLTEAASRQHAVLHNLPQGTAEEYYICACQKLDGYGEELFSVKHKDGREALIGIGLTGVSVGLPDRSVRHFGWSDISNVINHKKEFTIETVGGTDKAEFLFGDVESAKNAWRFCVLQHIFYRQYEMNNERETPDKVLAPPPVFQQQAEDRLNQMDSYEDITNSQYWDRAVSSSRSVSGRAQSTSCLDLNQSNDVDRLRSLLPSYRPAPDYETAVRQKYRGGSSILYSSQPEIHQAAHLRYPDVTHNNMEPKKMGIVHFYKQPEHRIGSNSTPDLPAISQQAKFPHHFVGNMVSGSSPDLVSNGNFYLKHLYQNQTTATTATPHPIHGTYENLSSVFIVENPNVTKHIKKVYDERGNIIYCVPANMKQILQENRLPASGFVVTRNAAHSRISGEPIYENLPVAWQNEGEKMRGRTQSIHSAPDISQVVNHAVVNAVQSQFQQLNLGNNENTTKENLYANINRTDQKVELHHTTSSDSTRAAPTRESPQISPGKHSNLDFPSGFTRTNTKSLHSANTSTSTNSLADDGAINTSNDTMSADISSSHSNSMGKTKKKRWGIIMGRGKSSERVSSATLGKEKKKEDKKAKQQRWSTGLQKFNPLPPSISKETMCQLLENKLADSQLFFEFDKIPKKKENADFSIALLPDNVSFNRFKDVLPYEDNRLRLTPSKNNKYGYINASHITATVGSKQRFYIAAQGPTRTTLPYFWQGVWEAEVYLMVQLTDPSEDMTYLPDADERCIDVNEDYQVWWEFSQKTGHCVTSKVRLCHVTSRRYRTIWHLHYTDWGDQGCPNSVAHFLGFLEEMQSVHQHSMGEIPPGHNKNPPILVHCTAGVGRTGLTILCDLLLYTVDHNQEVCIPGVVGALRQQRPLMIQTIAQYRFVYSLLIHYLKQTRLI